MSACASAEGIIDLVDAFVGGDDAGVVDALEGGVDLAEVADVLAEELSIGWQLSIELLLNLLQK